MYLNYHWIQQNVMIINEYTNSQPAWAAAETQICLLLFLNIPTTFLKHPYNTILTWSWHAYNMIITQIPLNTWVKIGFKKYILDSITLQNSCWFVSRTSPTMTQCCHCSLWAGLEFSSLCSAYAIESRAGYNLIRQTTVNNFSEETMMPFFTWP